MSESFPLEGTLRLVPSLRHDFLDRVAKEYAALADQYGPRNVLVLKRHPTGLDSLREMLVSAATDGTPETPRLESLPEHASKVLEEYDPTLDRLSYEERIELISTVIAGASRDMPPYLERARAVDEDAFTRDVGQLLLEATRQRIRLADLEGEPHEALSFLYAMNDRFHDVLADRGLIERADVVPRVVSLLEADADGLRSRVSDSFEAVLALEFEEFRALDRAYVAALTAEANLVCIGEPHVSVERTAVEPGRVDRLEPGLVCERLEPHRRSSPPAHAAITHFLGTGELTGSGTVRRLRAPTAREQVHAIGAEIGRLLDRYDQWRPDDIALAVSSVDRVPAVREGLREAGVPTATIGTHSLADDPAVAELVAVVTLAGRHRSAPDTAGRELEASRELLAARVGQPLEPLLESIATRGVSRGLERWMLETDLKGRVATEPWADAREQYQSVRRVLEIARFVERTDLVAPDWAGLARMLRRTIEYDAPYVHAVDSQLPTGGVTVCPVDALKYDRRKAVFLLDLVDGRYPGEHHLSQLFPSAWLRSMDTYPAVTDPTAETVTETFATAPANPADPFAAYHAQRARRRLAIGARAASTHLYCCSYEREAGGLRRTHTDSRYLQRIAAEPTFTVEERADVADETRIRGDADALEALLGEPWNELERVLREASTGGDVDLAETEALFQELAVVCEHEDIDAELREAVYTQFEFAAGEVLRDA